MPTLSPALHAFDLSLPLLLRDLQGEPLGPTWFREGARDVSALGSMTVLIGTGLLVITTHWLRDARVRALRVGIVLFGAIALNTALKALIARPRPDLFRTGDTGIHQQLPERACDGFRSPHYDHSAGSDRYARTRSRRPRFIAASAALLVVLIGLSRIYLGVHWPSDVLAGWALGFFSGRGSSARPAGAACPGVNLRRRGLAAIAERYYRAPCRDPRKKRRILRAA